MCEITIMLNHVFCMAMIMKNIIMPLVHSIMRNPRFHGERFLHENMEFNFYSMQFNLYSLHILCLALHLLPNSTFGSFKAS